MLLAASFWLDLSASNLYDSYQRLVAYSQLQSTIDHFLFLYSLFLYFFSMNSCQSCSLIRFPVFIDKVPAFHFFQ